MNSKVIIGGCICCISLFSCDTSAPPDPMVHKQSVAPTPSSQPNNLNPNAVPANSAANVSVFPVQNGWGYQILVNNKPYIKQAFIPAIQGKKAFEKQVDAQKVGDWVAEQIRRGKDFGISKRVMDSLGVKY